MTVQHMVKSHHPSFNLREITYMCWEKEGERQGEGEGEEIEEEGKIQGKEEVRERKGKLQWEID
jgi:hypothetical protein